MVVSWRVAQTCRCTAGRYSDDVFVFCRRHGYYWLFRGVLLRPAGVPRGEYSDDVFVFVGGTDIIGCFAACCSDLPVYRGEIQ